jgi:urea ABC transporter ATP-binding protein UrtD
MEARTTQALLYVDGVSVSFDGFRALNNLSLVMDPGEMRAIIGPNGAGKTTMMDVITGKTRPDAGQAFFGSTIDLLRLRENEIAQAGIGRKFQKPTVFEHLSVFENLELSLKTERGVRASLFFRLSGEQLDRIGETLVLIHLKEHAQRKAGALSHGQKQWLEIGMLLIQDPRLLLLDEPVAGMNGAERAATADVVRTVREQLGLSVVLVEHDMGLVMRLADEVTVLDFGRRLAHGTPDEIRRHPEVLRAYLGTGAPDETPEIQEALETPEAAETADPAETTKTTKATETTDRTETTEETAVTEPPGENAP